MSVARDETTPADGGFRRYRGAASDALPRYSVADSITPLRSVGFGAPTTLKATFWHAMIAETPQAGDPAFVSIAYNTGGGRVWRNRETTPTGRGEIAMQPFEGASWRFEWPVSFVHLYLPFSVIEVVCAGLFDRPLAHDDLRMASGIGDDPLCATVDSIRRRLAVTEPTNLLLDSWALILADSVMRRLSSHGARPAGRRLGRMPERRVADVVDLIEAHIDQDLRLESLASAAAMSTYHFARRFGETVGMSPHAYVLARRVCRAAEMLRRTDAGLAHVAAACGFANQAHFTTAFRRRTGITPGEYRRQRAM